MWTFWLITCVLIVTNFRPILTADKYICRCEKFAYKDKPFVAIWNSPTNGCDFNFSLPINLKQFGILENDHQTWDGKYVTVFASAQLGLYPYFVAGGAKNFNGGLPQLVDLGQHLRKARKDIETKIPDPNYNGLAVIDWEQWRPLWDTNWAPKKIYKVKSVDLVRQRHPHWTLGRILEEAKKEFEEAARALFEHTITLGKELRPKAFWGFYGFPDCYGNKDYDYQCIEKTKKQNDQLEWLFSASSALFPSMYLLKPKPGNHAFVLGRLRETLRFASKGFGANRRNIPVFVYHRNIYDEDARAYNFLQKSDLDNTIDVSAKLGTAGIVIWGNRFDENTSPEVCQKISNYVHNILGPYLQTKFNEVRSCAQKGCHSQGHCVDRTLLTPQLLQQYQSLNNSCGPVHAPQKPTRLEQLNHKEIEADMASPLLKTLRDRNHDITTAFQSSQQIMSKKMSDFFGAMGKNNNANLLKKNMFLQNRRNLTGLNVVKKSEISHVATSSLVKKPAAPAVLATPRLVNKNMTFAMHAGNRSTNGTRKHVIHSNTSSVLLAHNKTASSLSFNGKARTTNTTNLLNHNASSVINKTPSQQPVKIDNATKLIAQRNKSSGAGALGAERNEMHTAPLSNAHLNIENGKLSASITKAKAQNKTDEDGKKASSSKKSDIPVTPQDMIHQDSPTIDIDTENDERSSLAVIGQSLTNESKEKQGMDGATPDATKVKKNDTKQSQGRRKSEIYKAKKFDSQWMMTSGRKHKRRVWLPHIYVILIGISIAGALMFSLMFVAAYYYVNLRFEEVAKSQAGTANNDTTHNSYMTPNGHSSPIGSPILGKEKKSPVTDENKVVELSSNEMQEKTKIHIPSGEIIIKSNNDPDEEGQIKNKRSSTPIDYNRLRNSMSSFKDFSLGDNERLVKESEKNSLRLSLDGQKKRNSLTNNRTQSPNISRILSPKESKNISPDRSKPKSPKVSKQNANRNQSQNAVNITQTGNLAESIIESDVNVSHKRGAHSTSAVLDNNNTTKTKIPVVKKESQCQTENRSRKKERKRTKSTSASAERQNNRERDGSNPPRRKAASMSLHSLDIEQVEGNIDKRHRSNSSKLPLKKQSSSPSQQRKPKVGEKKNRRSSKNYSSGEDSEVEVDLNRLNR